VQVGNVSQYDKTFVEFGMKAHCKIDTMMDHTESNEMPLQWHQPQCLYTLISKVSKSEQELQLALQIPTWHALAAQE